MISDKEKERIIKFIKRAKTIKIAIARSGPNDIKEDIVEANLNDFIFGQDGTLELWHNTGYEI